MIVPDINTIKAVVFTGFNSNDLTIDHFTVVCSVAWPLNENEARVDPILIETSLLLLC